MASLRRELSIADGTKSTLDVTRAFYTIETVRRATGWIDMQSVLYSVCTTLMQSHGHIASIQWVREFATERVVSDNSSYESRKSHEYGITNAPKVRWGD